jgi:hypothetical protein
MNRDPLHSHGVADQESLLGDFVLIGQAIADAFRGMSAGSPPGCCCRTTIHYAAWR